MPLPNEHFAKIKEPSLFEEGSFRRKKLGEGIYKITGKLKEGGVSSQSYRFSKDLISAEEAKLWLGDSGIEFLEFSESSGEYSDYVPSNLISFSSLDDWRDAKNSSYELLNLFSDFRSLAENIMWSDIEDKVGSLKSLVAEFVDMLGIEVSQDEAPVIGEFAETTGGVEDVGLFESDAANGLLEMDVRIIKPGWGNSKDNHYYSRKMLKENASVFVGSKMYETDHRPSEKSTRTWVSTVKEIFGFDDDGSPLAKVVVHDPGFAQRVRNLSEAKLLDKLECSILANGTAKAGRVDGKDGKIVESITDVSSVDWVTKAGAGGQALSLSENDGGNMSDIKEEEEVVVSVVVENDDQGAQDKIEASETDGVQATETRLSESDVNQILGECKLPEASKKRITQGEYETKEMLQEAISAEVDYVKALTSSGKPFGQGETKAVDQTSMSESDYLEKVETVFEKYGLGG